MERIQQHEWEPFNKIERCKHCLSTKFYQNGIVFYWQKGSHIMKAQSEEPACINRQINATGSDTGKMISPISAHDPKPDLYTELFDYMSNEMGHSLLESDIQEIINIVNGKNKRYDKI